MFAALTLLPGILMLPGKHAKVLFWPAKLKHYATEEEAIEKSHGVWNRMAQFVAGHDRPVWIGTLALLGVCSIFYFSFPASGTSTTEQFTSNPEAVAGFKMLQEEFDAGSSQPTTLVIAEDQAEAVKEKIDALEGVASSEYATDEESSGMPAGVGAMGGGDNSAGAATDLAASAGESAGAGQSEAEQMPADSDDTASANAGAEQMAGGSAGMPADMQAMAQGGSSGSAGEMPADVQAMLEAEPAEPKAIDGKVLINITTTMPSEDKAASEVVNRIRSIAHAADPGALVGGPAAETLDTQTTAANDFTKIFPAVLAVIVALGILIDTFIVRTLTIVGITHDMGDPFWVPWTAKQIKPAKQITSLP